MLALTRHYDNVHYLSPHTKTISYKIYCTHMDFEKLVSNLLHDILILMAKYAAILEKRIFPDIIY